MAAYKKGDELTLPKRGYPAWTHGLKAVVHAVGPRGLLHLRIPFEGHSRYITRSVRELALSIALAPAPEPAPAITVEVPTDSFIDRIEVTLLPRKRRQRRAVSA